MKQILIMLAILFSMPLASQVAKAKNTPKKDFFKKHPQPIIGPLNATYIEVTEKQGSNNVVYWLPAQMSSQIQVGQNNIVSKSLEKPLPPNWDAQVSVVIPAFKIYETTKSGRKLDGRTLTALGGGLEFGKYKSKQVNNNPTSGYQRVSVFSYSPFTVLLSGNGDAFLDVSIAQTIGFFNNTLQFGGGYDFGEIDSDRVGRWFFLLSVGININANTN